MPPVIIPTKNPANVEYAVRKNKARYERYMVVKKNTVDGNFRLCPVIKTVRMVAMVNSPPAHSPFIRYLSPF